MKQPKFGVIASITVKYAQELLTAIYKSREATSLELRLDCLEPKERMTILPNISRMLTKQPTILTLRSRREQGGSTIISLPDQFAFWDSLPETLSKVLIGPDSNVFADFGLDLIEYMVREGLQPSFSWSKIGASVYDFKKTPEDNDLGELLARLEAIPAKAFLKLVTMAVAESDASRMEKFIHEYKGQRPLIAFAMGELGERTRKKCLLLGSAGTYGSVPDCEDADSNQISILKLLADPFVQKGLAGNIP